MPVRFLKKNDITFITFNYDRSLEKFLLQSAMSTFNLDVAAASEVCKNFHIHHMYGNLGDFEWENNLNYGLPKDPLNRKQVLYKATEGIKVMPAQRHKNADHVARQELADAEHVVFLGFGFDATNCARLGMPNVFIDSYGKNKFRQIFITTLGMTISEVERARQLMLGSENHQRDSVIPYNGYCYDALRNWGILPG